MFKVLQQIGVGTQESGELMEIMGFDGKPLEGNPTLTVLGRDSQKYRSTFALIQREVSDKYRENEDYTVSENESDERKLRLLSVCVVDFDGIVDENNQPIEWSVENATKLLEGSPYLQDKVDLFLSNRANYLVK